MSVISCKAVANTIQTHGLRSADEMLTANDGIFTSHGNKLFLPPCILNRVIFWGEWMIEHGQN
jgi:hypothetical protein